MAMRKRSPAKQKADEVLIPDKLYFRIGEVATLCRLPAYVLRFWESEFPQLKPVKSSTGQRMYRKRDVENVASCLYRQIKILAIADRSPVGSDAGRCKGFGDAPVFYNVAGQHKWFR